MTNIFYRLNLIEAYGTGVPRIMESYEEYEEKPHFEVTDNVFKITLLHRSFYTNKAALEQMDGRINSVTGREEQVLQLFDATEFIVRKDVKEAAGI